MIYFDENPVLQSLLNVFSTALAFVFFIASLLQFRFHVTSRCCSRYCSREFIISVILNIKMNQKTVLKHLSTTLDRWSEKSLQSRLLPALFSTTPYLVCHPRRYHSGSLDQLLLSSFHLYIENKKIYFSDSFNFYTIKCRRKRTFWQSKFCSG